MKNTLTLSCALALASVSGVAAAAQGAAGFIRGEIGRSDVEVTIEGLSGSEKDTSAILAGGYWFNANVGVEGHVGRLYNARLDPTTELDFVTLGLAVVGKKNFGPDGNGFFVGGRAGIARVTAQLRSDGFSILDDEHSTKPFFGVNVGYDFSERFGLSLNYDRRRAEFQDRNLRVDVDIDTLSLGGEFRF